MSDIAFLALDKVNLSKESKSFRALALSYLEDEIFFSSCIEGVNEDLCKLDLNDVI